MKDKVQVGNRWIGAGERAFIIAEAGSNHDQKLDQAKQLIDAAAEARADAIKFQLFAADTLYPVGTQAHAALKAVELPRAWIPQLVEHAAERGLMFLASSFDREAVDCLAAVNVPAYKWASSETVNLSLLKYAAGKHKPIFLSTGMCTVADIHEAVEVVLSEGNTDIILLQCTSLYPTAARHVHLRVMDTLRCAFQLPVGFSDHTTDLAIPAAAVARSACVIEKHLTLDRRLPGPDHGYALEPAEFTKMVEHIRATEDALGCSVKTMLPEEAEVARRSSIRAARDLKAGETLAEDAFVVQRPAQGIHPRFLSTIIGRRTREPIAKGEPITWEKLECQQGV